MNWLIQLMDINDNLITIYSLTNQAQHKYIPCTDTNKHTQITSIIWFLSKIVVILKATV